MYRQIFHILGINAYNMLLFCLTPSFVSLQFYAILFAGHDNNNIMILNLIIMKHQLFHNLISVNINYSLSAKIAFFVH